MSEFIAEAQVLIVPNVSEFAATLKAQLTRAVAAAGPVVIPVVAGTGTQAIAATQALTTAQTEASTAVRIANTSWARQAVILDEVAISAERTAASEEAAGFAANQAAVSSNRLAKAHTAGIAASERLALAQAGVEGSASAASAAQVTFTRSTAAVAAAQEAVVAALAARNIAVIDAAANSLRLAEADHAAALAALEAARADAVRTAALSQSRRAILAQAASAAGLRGAVLSSTAAFLGATVAAVAVGKSIQAASDLNEEINKTEEVFGRSADTIQEWSKTTAQAFGISRVEALRSIATFGELFRTLGVGTAKAGELSETLVELSADLASFFNRDPSDALRALQSGLVGQARPLRQFGVFLTEARVKQQALTDTGKKFASQLTQQDKILARYNLILRDASIASGDFERTQGQLANQSRILKANVADAGAQLGKVLLPAILFAVSGLNDFADSMRTAGTVVGNLGQGIGNLASEVERLSPVKFVIQIIEEVPGGDTASNFFKNFKANLEIGLGAAAIAAGVATTEIGVGLPVAAAGAVLFAKGMHDLNAELEKSKEVTDQVRELFQSFKEAGGGTTALNGLLLKLQALQAELSHGDAADRALSRGLLRTIIELRSLGNDPRVADVGKAIAEGIAKGFLSQAFRIKDAVKEALTFSQSQIAGQLQAQVTAVARAQAFGGTGLAELQRELARIDKILASEKAPIGPALESLLRQRKAVLDEIEGIGKTQDAAVLKNATDAAQKQNEALQAFIDTFSGKRLRLGNRLTSAESFGTAKTQIALNKLIIKADKEEIEAIRDRIAHLKLHGAALQLAKSTIQALNQEIFNTRNAILQLQSSRKQALADARQSHLEAQLAIAETTASTSDDRAAEKALIAFDQVQIRRILGIKRRRRLTQDEAAQLDAYRVDLAQRNAELRKTQEEQQKGSTIQQAFFKFLQTQQGFAANLLGNLIPGFATAGLVGGSTPITDPKEAALSTKPRLAQESAIASSRERGVRPVQVDTTNHLLRQILRSLQSLNGRQTHPEARYNREVGRAIGDTLGGV